MNESHWKQQIPDLSPETSGTVYHVQDFRLVYLMYLKEKKMEPRIYVRKKRPFKSNQEYFSEHNQ